MIFLGAGDTTVGPVAADKKTGATVKRRGEALTTTPLQHPGSGLLPVHTRSPGLVVDTTVPDYLVLVRHLGTTYMIVFKDGTYSNITSIWHRNIDMTWELTWSFLKKRVLTQRLKNISAKALVEGRTKLHQTLAATGKK